MAARAGSVAAAGAAGFLAVVGPAGAQSLIGAMSQGRWAVASANNCGIPAQTFSLSTSGNTVMWRDGLGNTYVEAIASSSPDGFTTVTVASSKPNVPVGTLWSYDLLDYGRVRVTPRGRTAFLLASCR